MRLCIFEDAAVAHLGPLTSSRPAFDLLCGASSLLDRHLRLFRPPSATALVRPELADLCWLAHPELADATVLRTGASTNGAVEGVVLVNARWLPSADAPVPDGTLEVGVVGEQVAYVVVPASVAANVTIHNLDRHLAQWQCSGTLRPAGGSMIDHPWDLVERNAAALEQDYTQWRQEREAMPVPAGVSVVGPPERFLADWSARLEPLVLIDTTRGPVLVDEEAEVQAFSRLEGPCYIGPRTHVRGAHIHGGSIGTQCRVGGEVEASIFQGYSNKAHEGFLGHAYVGEWVNFGAGTQNSDLRNDYASARMTLNGAEVDTGLLKVGAFVGDHTKTSINTLLNTGTVVGPFAHLLTCGSLLPRRLPGFCLFGPGGLQERTDLRQMFTTASRVMARREERWTELHTEFFLGLYERTEAERSELIAESRQRRLRRAM